MMGFELRRPALAKQKAAEHTDLHVMARVQHSLDYVMSLTKVGCPVVSITSLYSVSALVP